MTGIFNARILASVAMLVFVGAAIAASTGAFFSDTETSTGNTFTAGDVDITITDLSHLYTGGGVNPDQPTYTENGFSFALGDLKPLDSGTVTYNLGNGTNDAYLCAAVVETGNNENARLEPETEAGDVTDGAGNGELGQFLSFKFGSTTGTLNGQWQSLGVISANAATSTGIGYCFGTYAGGVCQASVLPNINRAQTDSITADVQFYAVQTRNNPNFSCSSLPPATGTTTPVGPTVGAALGAYSAPACTTTVNDGSSIQAAIDANAAGSTICVGPGTHDSDTYPLRVNENNMSLVSTAGAATTILNGGVILDNDGTRVSGFTLTSSTLLGETFGVYINTGVDNAVVSFNDMNGPGVASGRGVVNATNTTTGALIANNEISNYLTGVFLNPSSNMIVEKNDLVSNGVGSGNDNPTNNIVRNNQITGNTLEGVGVLSVSGNSIEVNFNNIFGNGGGANELNSYAVDTVDAEDNWWGDLTPADEIGGTGAASVDFTPFAGAAYAQN